MVVAEDVDCATPCSFLARHAISITNMARRTLSDVARPAGVDVSAALRVLRGEAAQRVR